MPGVARRCGNLRNMCRDPIYKLREAEDPEDRVGESIFQFEVRMDGFRFNGVHNMIYHDQGAG